MRSIITLLVTLPFHGLNANHLCDTLLIRQHLQVLTKTQGYRNHGNITLLNKTASYIYDYFDSNADTTYYQEFTANGKTYKNVVAVIGQNLDQTIVIGAHYDVHGNQEGADDNASGVVGLLELARLLPSAALNHRIELVAYTLEEPPYFRSAYMGSYVHAGAMMDADIYGMLSLEMIGYFSDTRKSQRYPIGLLSVFYGNRGNYITLVNKFNKGSFARKFTRTYKKVSHIKTKKFTGPRFLPGIDFSDHLNYWDRCFSALMITDTSFYRNPNYHKSGDTMETLDIPKLALVVDGVYRTIMEIK